MQNIRSTHNKYLIICNQWKPFIKIKKMFDFCKSISQTKFILEPPNFDLYNVLKYEVKNSPLGVSRNQLI